MEINVEKMIVKQEKLNLEIANAPVEREEEVIVADYQEKIQCTRTNILDFDDSIMLTRYMDNGICKVVFGKDVKVMEILPYLELPDSMFKRLCRRDPIKDLS